MNKFFTFYQNNSFGRDEGPAKYVIIEASSAKEANDIAELNGIYFDGVQNDIDCPCCGNRWSRQFANEEGTEKPEVFGEVVTKETPDCLIILKKEKE